MFVLSLNDLTLMLTTYKQRLRVNLTLLQKREEAFKGNFVFVNVRMFTELFNQCMSLLVEIQVVTKW